MNRVYTLIIILCFSAMSAKAQRDTINISLDQALLIANEQSLEAIEAKKALEIAFWEHNIYRADLLPNMSLSGTLPNLNRSLNTYQTEDGSYKFIPTQTISENLALSVTQNIPLTGGQINIQSQIDRVDQIGNRSSTNYLSVPVVLTFVQPLFSFNSLKWSKKIEPIKYTQAKKQYIVNREGVAVKTIDCYFNLLLSSINLNIAEQNLKNSTELYNIAMGKKSLGIISENDLKQLKLNQINAQASVVVANQDYQIKIHDLRLFLNLEEEVVIQPEIPKQSPRLIVDSEEVLSIVHNNNPFTESITRRLIESEMMIAEARSQRGIKSEIFASLGFTGTNRELPQAYNDLQNRQIITVGVRLPILDWKRGKGKVEIAKNRQVIEQGLLDREKSDFEHNVKMLTRRIHEQPYLTELYHEADSIAQSRYKIAFEIFVIGKINVLDINAAQIEEDNAKRNYINQLYFSWLYHYQLRQVALYDFEKKESLIENITGLSWTKKSLKIFLDKEAENQ